MEVDTRSICAGTDSRYGGSEITIGQNNSG